LHDIHHGIGALELAFAWRRYWVAHRAYAAKTQPIAGSSLE
jgi:hypothetical protein